MPKEYLLSGTRNDFFAPRAVLVWTLALAALAGSWLLSGCTSDIPSEVGTGLVDTHIDVVLQPLGLDGIEQYMGKIIGDDDLPVSEQEVLYMGHQGGTSSDVVVNYDFSSVYSDSFPESVWTHENITSVELRFLMLKYYGSLISAGADTNKTLEKTYELFELDEPFDPATLPGPVPAHGLTNLNIENEPAGAKELRIKMDPAYLLSWVQDAGVQGLLVAEGPGSDPGLTGYASKELTHYDTLDDVNADPGAAPVLLVHFAHTDSVFILQPEADSSTFQEVADAPASLDEGFMLRTTLRNYPMLLFDFSALPSNAFVNRAVLAVSNDTTSSFGNLQSVVVSEIGTEYFTDPQDTLALADLESAVYSISGMVNLDPVLNDNLEFNVTTAVQRIINHVYEGQRGFILTAGEDFLPAWDNSSEDPDFFFSQFNFFGSSAADSLRPRLKISYSLVSDIEGGDR